MTDRDRLIELIDKAKEEYANDVTDHTETDYIVECLLNNGVIVPPVEVGQTVYCVEDYLEVVEICKVYGFNVVNGKLSLLVDNGECKFITRKWHNTKEEAEEKLKELKDNVHNG